MNKVDIAEIIVYDVAISDGDQVIIQNYFANKYPWHWYTAFVFKINDIVKFIFDTKWKRKHVWPSGKYAYEFEEKYNHE